MAIREAAKLRKAELFQGLSDAAVQKILRLSARRDLFAGATLLKQGDEPECLFMVLEGRLRITALGKDGVQKTLRFMGPGEVVGCAAAFRRIPYPATATAVNDSIVLSWSLVKLDQLLREYPPI